MSFVRILSSSVFSIPLLKICTAFLSLLSYFVSSFRFLLTFLRCFFFYRTFFFCYHPGSAFLIDIEVDGFAAFEVLGILLLLAFASFRVSNFFPSGLVVIGLFDFSDGFCPTSSSDFNPPPVSVYFDFIVVSLSWMFLMTRYYGKPFNKLSLNSKPDSFVSNRVFFAGFVWCTFFSYPLPNHPLRFAVSFSCMHSPFSRDR